LELILAMALTCMLAMTLYATLRTAFRAQASATGAVEALRSAQIAMEFVGKDLTCALPPTGVMAGAFYGMPMGTPTTDSAGDMSDSVEFYAVVSGVEDDTDPTKDDGMKRINYTIAPGPNGEKCLVRRVQGNLTAQEQLPAVDEIICRNVASLSFQYFDGTQWTDTWDSTAEQDTLPLMVEVTIELMPVGNQKQGYRLTRTYGLPCTVAGNLTGGTT
jgi:type II secretion system protein J